MKENKINIYDVANYFISSNYDPSSESFITPLKLQKLCYYAQAMYLAKYKVPMFEEKFEAWVHGPVCPVLYEKYKGYGMSPIIPREEFDNKKFSREQKNILEYVQNEYGIYDGKFLEYVTHQEKPWQLARKGYSPEERCNVIIDENEMRKFYSNR